MRTIYIAAVMTALIATVGCAPTAMNRRRVSTALVVFSTAATACDYGQTLPLARAGWAEGREGNLLMGPAPSATTLTAYNAGVIAGNLALWKILPERYDWIVPLGLSIIEAGVIQMNWLGGAPRPLCGIR